jgi:hypothetical protein
MYFETDENYKVSQLLASMCTNQHELFPLQFEDATDKSFGSGFQPGVDLFVKQDGSDV